MEWHINKPNINKKNIGYSNAMFSVCKTVEYYVNGDSTVDFCAVDLSN